MSSATSLLLPLLLLLLLLLLTPSTTLAARSEEGLKGDDADTCVYTVYVRTSTIWKGGTDSVISLALNDSSGNQVQIPDLEAWGLMEPGHDYYERGNLDIFSVRAPCLASPPCAMLLASDGAGAHHGWYCNYVEVTSTGPHMGCAQQQFTVEQWLATDTWPFKLTAEKDYCSDKVGNADGDGDGDGDGDVDLALIK